MSASSTLPRTNTWLMSPSVITSVAAEPMLRIDDTGLPISTSRVSTMPWIGARIVALRSSSSARSTAACACATLACASATLRLATTSCTCAAALAGSAPPRARSSRRRATEASTSCCAAELLARARSCGARTRRRAPRPRSCSSRAAPRRLSAPRFGRLQIRARFAHARAEVLLVELDEHVAGPRRSDRRRRSGAR